MIFPYRLARFERVSLAVAEVYYSKHSPFLPRQAKPLKREAALLAVLTSKESEVLDRAMRKLSVVLGDTA